MNIFFLGGSFDPPHAGHLEMARKCLDRFHRFFFIPARKSPLKDELPHVADSHRIAMLEIVSKHIPGSEVLDIELNRPAPSYTITTIQTLQNQFPGDILYMLLGADQYADLHRWHQFEEIEKSVKLVCFHRSGQPNIPQRYARGIDIVRDFDWPISSSEIRERLRRDDQSVSQWLDPDVYSYINHHKLYR